MAPPRSKAPDDESPDSITAPAPADAPATADPAPVAEPAFYVAASDLYVGDPEASGVMPAKAFSAGDHVLPGDIDRHGWRDQVRRPDTNEE